MKEIGFKLPQSYKTLWNYYWSNYNYYSFYRIEKVITCVTEENYWDPTTISMARGLLRILSNTKFVYLLCSKNYFYTLTIHCVVNELIKNIFY